MLDTFLIDILIKIEKGIKDMDMHLEKLNQELEHCKNKYKNMADKDC